MNAGREFGDRILVGLVRVEKHYPGGKDHDQSTHGRRRNAVTDGGLRDAMDKAYNILVPIPPEPWPNYALAERYLREAIDASDPSDPLRAAAEQAYQALSSTPEPDASSAAASIREALRPGGREFSQFRPGGPGGRHRTLVDDVASWPDLGEQQWLREQTYRREDELSEKFGDLDWEAMGPVPSVQEVMTGTGKQWYHARGFEIKRAPGVGWKLTYGRRKIGEFAALSDAQAAAWSYVKERRVSKHYPGGHDHDQSTHGRRRASPNDARQSDTKLGEKMAEELEEDTLENEGASYQVANKSSPIKGMILSIYPDRTKTVKPRGFSHQSLSDYVKKNADLLSRQDHYLGTWVKPETGVVYLDVSVIVPDPRVAEKLCVKYAQDSYFDLEKKREVRVRPLKTRAA